MKTRFVLALMAASLCISVSASGQITEGSFKFTTFDVPGTPSGYGMLGVENINDFGVVVGYSDQSPTIGYMRKPDGKITDLVDPLSTGPYEFTGAYGVNVEGTVAGYFFDTANDQYSGYFYKNGTFTTYNIPGLPQYSTTAILGINDFGAFAGFYEVPPAYAAVPFVNFDGHIDTNFVIPASTFTEPVVVNDFGQVAGIYVDGSGVDHGFFRDDRGKITSIDVPGAASPGTVVLGLNNFGWISGHFWDAENHEHGFVRSPEGQFFQIDVPGANTTTAFDGTAGGGINDFGVVAGHFDPGNGAVEEGYIAEPKLDMKCGKKKEK
jgi:hypothetical protein